MKSSIQIKKTDLRPDGFEGQIKKVIPRSILKKVAHHPLVSDLYVTDMGWYPRAEGHYRIRPQGANEWILIFSVNGDGFYHVANKKGILKKNHLLLIPQNTPHIYGASKKKPWSIYFIHFSGSKASEFVATLGRNPKALSVPWEMCEKIKKLFQEAFEILDHGFQEHDLIRIAQLIRYLLADFFYSKNIKKGIQSTPPQGK